MRIEFPVFLASWGVRIYRKLYNIDMVGYEGELEDYASISKFFLRPLNPKTRPLERIENCLLSPADGKLVSIEKITEDKATQVKGSVYSVNELLHEEIDYSEGWYLATIYLSPADYHRYHYPVTGNLTGYCHTRGPLFPVNESGLKYVKGLFVRNERIICKLNSGGHKVYFVAVGATNVGSIKMEFIEGVSRDNKWKSVSVDAQQMDEMGRFEMGSTIILVVPANMVESVEKVENSSVKVGEPIFRFK